MFLCGRAQSVQDCLTEGSFWSANGCIEALSGRIPTEVPDDACTEDNGGLIRYHEQVFQICSAETAEWDDVFESVGEFTMPGTEENPGESCSQIYEVSEGQAESGRYFIRPNLRTYVVYCDMGTPDPDNLFGWTLLLQNAAGDTFNFHSPLWVSSSTHNPNSPRPQFHLDAKYQAYNDMPVEYLRIVTEAHRDATLKLPEESTMLVAMQGGTKNLVHIAGGTPAQLGGNQNYGHCDTMWRMNSRGNYQVRWAQSVCSVCSHTLLEGAAGGVCLGARKLVPGRVSTVAVAPCLSHNPRECSGPAATLCSFVTRYCHY